MAYRTKVRELDETFRDFYGIDRIVPTRADPSLKIVAQYENALNRIQEKKTPADFIDMGSNGAKLAFKVPEGEIWIVEAFHPLITTGSTAVFNTIKKEVKGGSVSYGFMALSTPATSLNLYRQIHYSDTIWFYPGDVIYANVSTGSAGDKGQLIIFLRILKVGDAY